jgi:polar amino acid transport system substrate-binding protein
LITEKKLKKGLCFLILLQLVLLPKVFSAEKIIFASPENLPPKIYMENGKLIGTYVDIIKAVCKRMRVEPVFVQYPWPRAVIMVKNGKVDAIFPPFKTSERQEFLYFPSEPISLTRNVLFARKIRNIKVKKLSDLQNFVVGINDQYSYGPYFDNYKSKLKLEVSRTEEMQIKKLSHKGQIRMDVAAASEEAFKYLSAKLGQSNELEVVYVLSETPSYVAFSKSKGDNKKLAQEFSRVIKQLRKEGVIRAINDHYLK